MSRGSVQFVGKSSQKQVVVIVKFDEIDGMKYISRILAYGMQFWQTSSDLSNRLLADFWRLIWQTFGSIWQTFGRYLATYLTDFCHLFCQNCTRAAATLWDNLPLNRRNHMTYNICMESPEAYLSRELEVVLIEGKW